MVQTVNVKVVLTEDVRTRRCNYKYLLADRTKR